MNISADKPVLKTMYRVHSWKKQIDAVEVVKETPHFITIVEIDWNGSRNESRRAKDGFYDTWEAARNAEVLRRERIIEGLKTRVHAEQSALGEWRFLKPSPAPIPASQGDA